MAALRQLSNLPAPAWPAPPAPDTLAGPDPPGQGGGMSLTQVLMILRARWKPILIITFTIICITAVVVKRLPKTYEAVATLIVNTQSRDPLAAQAAPADFNYVATQTELMLSPVILLPVVDRLKLTEDKDIAHGFDSPDVNARRENAERSLWTRLDIGTGRGGQLLYVTATDKDPVKAALLANTVTDVYLEEEQRRISGPASERAVRYSAELAELRAKATAAQDKVIEFQQRHGITDLTAANSGTEMMALDNLEQQLLAAQSTRRSLEAQMVGEEASTNEVVNSDLIQQLKGELNTRLARLAEAKATYGPNHPQVRQLQAQIDATQRQISAEVRVFAATIDTQLSRAKQLETKLADAVAKQRGKVLVVRGLQDEGAKLLVERDSAQAVYKRALDGYDQILFAAFGHDANVSLVRRATPAVQATKPNKKKLFMIGSIAGLLLGLLGPVAYELLHDRRVRCRDDIERSFGIPVLVQFERIARVAGSQ
jgi:protein tyrosine kinase modulator